ncbi:hypothetical protein D7X88_01955 [bacterium C-53]|nr:hypothetical protein [Lachnospiraceae bacterium]NBI01780.1 hypothetical protein [Lachnospiraceae bacterium]RKJ12198.1 hypothetical protein D7X88_01955 [bacterium C-53]
MTKDDKVIIERINAYAEEVLKDIDPQKTRTGFQIQQLTPILKTIAKELNLSLEDMFVKYMDLQTEFAKEKQDQFNEDFKDLGVLDMETPFH